MGDLPGRQRRLRWLAGRVNAALLKRDEQPPRYRRIIDLVRDLLTIAAILVGGIWSGILFMEHREAYPRLTINLKVTHHRLSSDSLLLGVDAVVDNVGMVRIKPLNGHIQVFQVLPLTEAAAAALAKHELIPGGLRDADWPRIGFKEDPYGSTRYLEPGESEFQHYEFVVPRFVRTVNVVAFYRNPVLSTSRDETGWLSLVTYDIPPGEPRP